MSKLAQARQIAQATAFLYLDALASEIPLDVAPDGVNLIEACTRIQDAIQKERADSGTPDDNEDAAMHAGYLLGVEIGRRIGGGR